MSCCKLPTLFAFHMNVFSLYASSLEQFRKRDVLATYIYLVSCSVIIVVYAIRHFSTTAMEWSCVVPLTNNSTCPDSHYLYGGNACCIFKEETFTRKFMIFVSVSGGFLTSLLFLVIGVLQCSKFFQGKDRVRIPDRLVDYSCRATQTISDEQQKEECLQV